MIKQEVCRQNNESAILNQIVFTPFSVTRARKIFRSQDGMGSQLRAEHPSSTSKNVLTRKIEANLRV